MNIRTADTSLVTDDLSEKLLMELSESAVMEESAGIIEERYGQMVPIDQVAGFWVRPGLYTTNGATALPGAVNFTVHSHGAVSCELLLYHRMENKPYAVIPFPEQYKVGNVFSMIVFELKITEFEYAYRLDGPYNPKEGYLFDKTRPLLDPYAKAVTGQSVWGVRRKDEDQYHARVVKNNFDWKNVFQPNLSMSDSIIYEMHVRGFTMDPSSGVKNPGTFDALMERIPYLKDLGITTVELMPIFEFDETQGDREMNGEKLYDFWGYNTVSFFAPNTSYTAADEYNREGEELKLLIRTLHENQMEVILDVVFNHTAEGNEQGPVISFKGFDNNIYYMLTPDGYYYNFSGCGNTLNCNHPIVQEMIVECLRYWVTSYQIDGFRFDLASILGRNDDGTPMTNPPLLRRLAFDPLLGNTKLIAEAWDAGGLYQVGSFPAFQHWAEWNGKYRDDLRSFLKGDYWVAPEAIQRIIGSPDLYASDKDYRGYNSSVNFITCHDGFTLCDLYSYNEKHNEANGWNNSDGADDNRSWNCGVEGPTDNEEIKRLRMKLMKNACAVLMLSRGTPMILSGDEFGFSKKGNNNTYCHDNELSWLNWNLIKENEELYLFFKKMIACRKAHKVISRDIEQAEYGFPSVSTHTTRPWETNITDKTKVIAVMYAGYDVKKHRDDIVYIAVNSYWEEQKVTLPLLPDGYSWKIVADTGAEPGLAGQEKTVLSREYLMRERSVLVLETEYKI